nr:oligopeptidase B [Flavobacterium sp.]
MNKTLILLGLFFCSIALKAQFQKAATPVAEKKPHWRNLHDDKVLDNYYWMYDYFGKGPDSTKAVDYLKAENAYLETTMSGTNKIQAD